MNTRKVGIIGLGNVGSHCALSLVIRGIADELILVDIDRQKAVSERQDLIDCISYLPHNIKISVGDYEDLADSDIVVIALANKQREFVHDRLNEYQYNIHEIEDVIPKVVNAGFKGIFVSITNPCDVIAYKVRELSGFPASRVIGTGTILDSSRLRTLLGDLTGLNPKSIQAYTMGEHGNSQMIPWSQISFSSIPYDVWKKKKFSLTERIVEEKILGDVRNTAWVVYQGKQCTDFAIGQALSEVVQTIYRNEHTILPVSTLLTGQYGVNDIYASTLCQLGKSGIEQVFEAELTEKELREFQESCKIIESYIRN